MLLGVQVSSYRFQHMRESIHLNHDCTRFCGQSNYAQKYAGPECSTSAILILETSLRTSVSLVAIACLLVACLFTETVRIKKNTSR